MMINGDHKAKIAASTALFVSGIVLARASL